MLYLFLNIIMKMLEFTFLNPNIYYRTKSPQNEDFWTNYGGEGGI